MQILTKKDVIDDIKYLVRNIPSKPWDSSTKKIYRHRCALLMESICGMKSNFIRVTFYPQDALYDGDKKIETKDFGIKEGVYEDVFNYIEGQLYLAKEED